MVKIKILYLFLILILFFSWGCSNEEIPKGALIRVKLNNEEAGNKSISGQNESTYEFVKDDHEGTVLKLSTSDYCAYDPYVTFNFAKYIKEAKIKDVNADKFDYVILKIKTENLSGSSFELFFAAGQDSGIVGGNCVTATYDNSDDDWQYISFDLSNRKWSGKVNMFRFDFTSMAVEEGESIYISEIMFARDKDIAMKAMGIDISNKLDKVLDKETEEYINRLLSIKDKKSEYSLYKQLTAEKESKDIELWFDHMYTRTPETQTKPGNMKTYQLRLAKNELESCQFILSSKLEQKGLTLELSNFTNKSGKSLNTEILYGHYFEVKGSNVIDPLPPLTGAFDIESNTSKTFVIKIKTLAGTEAGEYKAILILKDSNGNEIKKANVFAYVWDFDLPEETSCKTLMDLSWYNIYSFHKCYEGDDSQLYKNYYDYLLENRICSYTLPYNRDNYSDDRILSYLNNPRVVAFLNMGWKANLNEGNIKNSYTFLSQKEEWVKKAYFYPVDEPMDLAMLKDINAYGELIKNNFPDYKLIVPIHLNSALDNESKVDYFEYVSDYVNAWCPKTYFFNTLTEYKKNPTLTYYMSGKLEKNLGTFPERMAFHKAEGDEVWWYVTRRPSNPEITLTMETQALKYRLLFWQQKLYNVDNFLYYLSNDWFASEDDLGWNSKHENTSEYNVYGNGVLIYCGAYKDIYGPVGSLRLECVRDGIEDFEYLTILEEHYSKETVDNIISRITTSLAKYTTDEDLFTEVKVALGNLVERTLKDGVIS